MGGKGKRGGGSLGRQVDIGLGISDKKNSAEDGIDGTNGYFRRNSGFSAEQKISEFRSEPFRGRANNSEFRSVEQKYKQTPIILFRTILRKRNHLRTKRGSRIASTRSN